MYNDDDEQFEYSYDGTKHLCQSPLSPKIGKNKRMKWGRMYKRRIIKNQNFFVLRLLDSTNEFFPTYFKLLVQLLRVWKRLLLDLSNKT